MKRNVTILSLFLITVFAITACSPAAALSALTGSQGKPVAQVATPAVSTQIPLQGAAPVTGSQPSAGALDALQGTLEQIYSQVNPSVVNIQVVEGVSQSQSQIPNFPFGFGNGNNGGQGNQAPVAQALGSGFVWDNQGHIVTNNHVVDGSTSISVTFSDGFTVPAKVVGTDVNSDLAVVQVEAGNDHLHPITLADSAAVKVGQLAIAIGNPFGLQGTMTQGIISAVGRSLPVNSNATDGGSYTIPYIIQTDAPINPGNSGGVLLNDQGQVVGVTSAIESSVQSNSGVGFAIPSVIVNKVVPALIQKGSYQYPYLGLSGATLSYDLNQAIGNGVKTDQRGVLVVSVTPGGPADKAGIKGSSRQATVNGQNAEVGGDIITAINGQPVNTFEDMVGYLILNANIGQKVTLSVLRNGSQQQVDVTLGTRPSQTGQQAQSSTPFFNFGNNNNNNQGNNNGNNNQGGATAGVYLGITGMDLTPELDQAAGLNNNQQGVLVEQVQAGSPAQRAGLQGSTKSVTVGGQQVQVGGDVITAIDGNQVASVQDLQSQLQNYQAGQNATLTVLRNGQQAQITVTLAARPVSQP